MHIISSLVRIKHIAAYEWKTSAQVLLETIVLYSERDGEGFEVLSRGQTEEWTNSTNAEI
jgi:hypothetical protein